MSFLILLLYFLLRINALYINRITGLIYSDLWFNISIARQENKQTGLFEILIKKKGLGV